MKLSDTLINLILKKGVLNESRNVAIDIDIPRDGGREPIHVMIKIDNMQVKIQE